MWYCECDSLDRCLTILNEQLVYKQFENKRFPNQRLTKAAMLRRPT